MAQSPTTVVGRAPQMTPRLIPTLNTTQPASDPSVPHKIHYLEEGVQEDANYQVQWSNWMSDGQQQSCYKHVFVLLLRWHAECDDLDVEPEVQRLKNVFENTYNYEVESYLIDSRRRALPQVQANQTVANFVEKHDQENTLFIVYYAGHGSPGKDRGDLKMSGRRRQEKLQTSQQFSHFSWNLVESNLRNTRADVLLIFDCCHASDLGRDSSLTSRSFEYLAASNSSFTASPGKKSFTSALIWGLEKLASQSARAAPQVSPMFTTSKLAKIICDAPGFPEEQFPQLTSRDPDAYRHIILAPLPREGGSVPLPTSNAEDENKYEDEDGDDKPVPQFLSLTFHFKHKQEETELKKLADHLKTFMKLDNISLQRVQWGGIWSGWRQPPGHRWRYIVRRLMSQSQSPVSGLKSSFFPSNDVESGRLAPHTAYNSPYSPTEHTPLLSGQSSVTLEEEADTWSLWNCISSFFRGLRRPTQADPSMQPTDMITNGRGITSRKWTSRLMNRLRKTFYGSSPKIQLPS